MLLEFSRPVVRVPAVGQTRPWLGSLTVLFALALATATPFASEGKPRKPGSTRHQATGNVQGTVVNEAGVAFGFVDVFLESMEGSHQAAELADDEGRFHFARVPVGEYKLYAYAAGFASNIHENLRVRANSRLEFRITMRAAEFLTESITIDCRLVDRVDTKKTDNAMTLTGEFIEAIPLGTTRIQDLVSLSPGLAHRGAAQSGEISIAGGDTGSINYVVDGLGGSSPEPSLAPPVEREAYSAIEPDDFHDAEANPLSTFAVDVDTAAYSNLRRFLQAGRWPAAGAVRIEEMLNSFAYDDPGPIGVEPFGVSAEVSDCPWAPTHRLVRIALKGRDAREVEAGPLNLHFLVDVSGSMRGPGRLPLVRQALILLLEGLTARDRVSLTVYAGAAGVVLPPTSGAERATIAAAIGRLQAGGSTNGAGGIQAAYDMARASFVTGGVNRVILATDGDFNVGLSSEAELVTLIEGERESGVFLTVLGVGTGNLQDSRLEALADSGNGQYAYLDSLREAEKVLVRNAGGTLLTLAKDVKIQVEMNPARVASWRLIGYENRELAAEDFADDSKDGGEIGAGHSVVALYEVVPRGAEPAPARSVEPLRYRRLSLTDEASSRELLLVKLRWKRPDGELSSPLELPVTDFGGSLAAASDDLRFSVAVASFGEKLRSTPTGAAMRWEDIRALADSSRGSDPFGDRAELLSLIDLARGLEP